MNDQNHNEILKNANINNNEEEENEENEENENEQEENNIVHRDEKENSENEDDNNGNNDTDTNQKNFNIEEYYPTNTDHDQYSCASCEHYYLGSIHNDIALPASLCEVCGNEINQKSLAFYKKKLNQKLIITRQGY